MTGIMVDNLALVNSFGSLVYQNQLTAYVAVYLLTLILGNITSFAGLWLAFEGLLGRWGIILMIFAILAADVTGDILWYSLGRALRDTRFGNFVKRHLPHHQKIEAHLQKNCRRWIFLSKFIAFSTFTIVFSVGWAKIDFKKFFRVSLLAIASWVPILALITYGLFSGLTPLVGVSSFRKLEYLLAMGIISFFIIDYLLGKTLKNFLKKILNRESLEGQPRQKID